MPEPLKISPSAIGTLESCPQKYLFNGAWKLRGGPAAAMSFGSVMHNTIKYFIGELAKGHTLPFEEVERKFELEWTSAGFEDDYQEQEYKKDGLAQLRAFHASTLAAPPDVIAQEKAFDLPMDNNVVLTGRMDQVNRLGPGEEEIVDYKTGKPRNEDKAKKDVQLSVYALAAREVFDWNPAQAHAALPADESSRERHARRKAAQESARGNSGSRRRHSRRRISRQARLCVQVLRFRIHLPGARTRRGGQRFRRRVICLAQTVRIERRERRFPIDALLANREMASARIKKGGHVM